MTRKIDGITNTPTELLRSKEDQANRIKAIFIELHNSYKNSGDPVYIITSKEAAAALGCNETRLQGILQSAFADGSLKNILKHLGLPYEKKQETTPNFTKDQIEKWFLNYYRTTGVLPNKLTHDEACTAGELPNAANFKTIMKSDVRAYLRQFKAWVETRKITR